MNKEQIESMGGQQYVKHVGDFIAHDMGDCVYLGDFYGNNEYRAVNWPPNGAGWIVWEGNLIIFHYYIKGERMWEYGWKYGTPPYYGSFRREAQEQTYAAMLNVARYMFAKHIASMSANAASLICLDETDTKLRLRSSLYLEAAKGAFAANFPDIGSLYARAGLAGCPDEAIKKDLEALLDGTGN